MIGRCPKCRSTYYSPDPTPGGAGRNWCRSCAHVGPVAHWHEPEFAAPPNHIGPVMHFRSISKLRTDRPAAPIRQYKDD